MKFHAQPRGVPPWIVSSQRDNNESGLDVDIEEKTLRWSNWSDGNLIVWSWLFIWEWIKVLKNNCLQTHQKKPVDVWQLPINLADPKVSSITFDFDKRLFWWTRKNGHWTWRWECIFRCMIQTRHRDWSKRGSCKSGCCQFCIADDSRLSGKTIWTCIPALSSFWCLWTHEKPFQKTVQV